jgi:hypothetical protein
MAQPGILKSYTFATMQFACLGLIAITGPIFPENKFLLAVEFWGIGIGIR